MHRNINSRLQAHRGDSRHAPENTLPAFRAAKENGFDFIETDPKFTRDGVCVLLHDRSLNRTGRLNGTAVEEPVYVQDLTYEQLMEWDVGSYFSADFAGQRVPTLKEGIEEARRLQMPLKIDNVFQSFTPEQRYAMYDVIEQCGYRDVQLCTCELPYFIEAAARFPGATLHWDGEMTSGMLQQLAAHRNGGTVVHWIRTDNQRTAWNRFAPATPELVRETKQYGDVGVWGIVTREELDAALAMGADYMEVIGDILD